MSKTKKTNTNTIATGIEGLFEKTFQYVKKMGIEAHYPKLIALINEHADAITDMDVAVQSMEYAKNQVVATGNRDYELAAKIFEIRTVSLQPGTEEKVKEMRREQCLLSTELIQKYFENEEEHEKNLEKERAKDKESVPEA